MTSEPAFRVVAASVKAPVLAVAKYNLSTAKRAHCSLCSFFNFLDMPFFLFGSNIGKEFYPYHASEMLRLMDEVGKITEFDYMLSVKVLDRMDLMPEGKLAVVFLSGIRITI